MLLLLPCNYVKLHCIFLLLGFQHQRTDW